MNWRVRLLFELISSVSFSQFFFFWRLNHPVSTHKKTVKIASDIERWMICARANSFESNFLFWFFRYYVTDKVTIKFHSQHILFLSFPLVPVQSDQTNINLTWSVVSIWYDQQRRHSTVKNNKTSWHSLKHMLIFKIQISIDIFFQPKNGHKR